MKGGNEEKIINKLCKFVTYKNKQLISLAVNSLLNIIFGLVMVTLLLKFGKFDEVYMPYYYNSFPFFTIICAIIVPIIINSMHNRKERIMREEALSSNPSSSRYKKMKDDLSKKENDKAMADYEKEFGNDINTE